MLFFVVSSASYAQPNKNVETIDKYCATVDASKLLAKEFRGADFLEQATSRESAMIASFQGTILKKIKVTLSMGFCTRHYTFYYDSNLLMKAVFDITEFDKNQQNGEAVPKELFHGDYYFISEFLVSQSERGKWLFSNPANERNAIVKLESNYFKGKALGTK